MKWKNLKKWLVNFMKPSRLNLIIFGLFITFFIFLYFYGNYCKPETDWLKSKCSYYSILYTIVIILASPGYILVLIFGNNPPKKIELFLITLFWLYLMIFYYFLSCFIAYIIKRVIVHVRRIDRRHKKIRKRGNLIILFLFFTVFVTTVSAIPTDANLSNNVMNVNINVYEMNSLKVRCFKT